MIIKINGTTVDSEVLPINKPTLDETLETFSFALKSTTLDTPYAPMQEVEITTDDDEVINLLIASDTVEPFSLNPITYKHNITCIENTRKLSKHIVRNSVFTQPAYLSKESYNAVNVCTGGTGTTSEGYIDDYSAYYIRNNEETNADLNPASVPMILDERERIKKAYILVSVFIANGEIYSGSGSPSTRNAVWKNDFKSFSEIADYYNDSVNGTSLTINNIQLVYTLNNATQTETIDMSSFPLNTLTEYPRIVELRNQGAKNFELRFTQRVLIGGIYNYNTVVDSKPYFRTYIAQLKIIAETYYYNAYDLLDLLIKRQQQKYTANNTTYEKVALFKLPTSGDLYNLLNNTVVPNFAFTQLTLYECVAEVFRLFDSIFTMSSDGTLGITYFNQANKTPKTLDFTGITLALSEDKYTNALQTYYQEAQQLITFPNNDNFIPTRSEGLGIPEEQDHYVILPHPIHSVEKLYFYIPKMSITTQHMVVDGQAVIVVSGGFTLDLSFYVYESSIWSLLNANTTIPLDTEVAYQNNTFFYTRGDNKISIAYTYKNSWGITDHAFANVITYAICRCCGCRNRQPVASLEDMSVNAQWYKYKFKATYITSVDGTTKTHSVINKTDGEMLIDQSNGAVDLNKLGLNMLGTTVKLGEPSLNATQKITTWSNRVKIGDTIIYQGNRWVANVVAYNLLGNGYLQAKITFVKNFNALALYTKINRVRRFSNVSSELTTKSEDIITNYIYFAGAEGIAPSSYPTGFRSGRQVIPFDESYLAKALYLSFTDDSSVILTLDFASLDSGDIEAFIPMVIYGAGNTINFEISFNFPISAGYKTTYGEVQTWYGASKYFSTSVNYTDDNGFLDKCNITIYGNANVNFNENFPDISTNTELDEATTLVNIKNYYVYKQPNEIFALNYQLAFLGFNYTKDFVGSAFINDNFFTNGYAKKRALRFYYGTEQYNILDTKGQGNYIEVQSVEYQYYTSIVAFTNCVAVKFYLGEIDDFNVSNYSICDDNGNILFAFNRSTRVIDGYISIYFKARQTR